MLNAQKQKRSEFQEGVVGSSREGRRCEKKKRLEDLGERMLS